MIEYSLYKKSDIKEINEFYNTAYKKNRTEENFNWEFNSSPAGKAIYVIAKDTDKNKIVGTQCAIPIFFSNSNGIKILTAKSEDTLVDNNYRGQNIFENMYNLLFEECKKFGITCLWGFTPALKPFKRIGFEAPFIHAQSLMVRNIIKSYSYLVKLKPSNAFSEKIKIFGLSILSKVYSLKNIFIDMSVLNPYRIEINQNRVQIGLEQLQKLAFNKDSEIYYIEETKDYLDWRISNNLNHKKIFSVAFYKNEILEANILFNVHENNIWYLIEDLYNNELNEKIKQAMFCKAINILSQHENPYIIRTWEFDHNVINLKNTGIHKSAGMLKLNRGIHFVMRNLISNNIDNANNIFLSRMSSQGVI